MPHDDEDEKRFWGVDGESSDLVKSSKPDHFVIARARHSGSAKRESYTYRGQCRRYNNLADQSPGWRNRTRDVWRSDLRVGGRARHYLARLPASLRPVRG